MGKHLRYAIVKDAEELLTFVLDKDVGKHPPYDCIRIPTWHLDRYKIWEQSHA